MYNIVNLILTIIIFLFILIIYNHYSSNINIKNIYNNRSNIEEILNSQITHLPILENDTQKVIEFNSSFFNEIQDNQKRNFWNLLKIK